MYKTEFISRHVRFLGRTRPAKADRFTPMIDEPLLSFRGSSHSCLSRLRQKSTPYAFAARAALCARCMHTHTSYTHIVYTHACMDNAILLPRSSSLLLSPGCSYAPLHAAHHGTRCSMVWMALFAGRPPPE